MKFFKIVPHLKECCYCIKLKIGCAVIAVIHLIFVVEAFLNVGGNDEFSKCYTTGTVTRLISYIAFLIAIALLGTMGYLMYGIYKGLAEPVLYFLCIVIVLIGYHLFICLILFTTTKSVTDLKQCSPGYILGTMTLVAVIFQLYSVIILASYYRELKTMPRPIIAKNSLESISSGKKKRQVSIAIDENQKPVATAAPSPRP